MRFNRLIIAEIAIGIALVTIALPVGCHGVHAWRLASGFRRALEYYYADERGYDPALLELRRIREIDPEFVPAAALQARILASPVKQRWDEAQSVYTRLTRTRDATGRNTGYLGLATVDLAREPGSSGQPRADELNEARLNLGEVSPDLPDLPVLRAALAMEEGRYQDAREDLESVVSPDPLRDTGIPSLDALASAYYNAGLIALLTQPRQPDEALAHFQRALTVQPQMAVAHDRLLQTLLHQLTSPDGSVTSRTRAIATAERLQQDDRWGLTTDRARIRNAIGVAYYKDGDLEKAETAFAEAARQDAKLGVAQANLARTRWRLLQSGEMTENARLNRLKEVSTSYLAAGKTAELDLANRLISLLNASALFAQLNDARIEEALTAAVNVAEALQRTTGEKVSILPEIELRRAVAWDYRFDMRQAKRAYRDYLDRYPEGPMAEQVAARLEKLGSSQ